MSKPFAGFEAPEANFSKLPHALINALPLINSLAEMKVILYVLRHTWGFSEYENSKRITFDEFMNGRKNRHGGRIDGGTGMSENSVKDGVKRAVDHGFLVQESDGKDFGRSSYVYRLNIIEEEPIVDTGSKVDPLPFEGDQKLTPRGSEVDPRSEKETQKDIKPKRKKESAQSAQRDPLLDDERIKSYRAVLHITPNHKQRELIANTVKDEKKWLDTLAYWAYHGYNPRDAANVVDCYTKGGAYRQGGKPAPREKTADEYKADAARYGLTGPDVGDDNGKPPVEHAEPPAPQPKREPDYWQRLVELVFQGKPPRDKIGRAVEGARYAGITPDGTMEVIAACDEDRLLLEGRVLPYARQYVHLLNGGSIARVAFVGDSQ